MSTTCSIIIRFHLILCIFLCSIEIGKTAYILSTRCDSDSPCHHSQGYSSSSRVTLNPGRPRGISAVTDLSQQAVPYETTHLVPWLTPGCLQYVDSPQVFPRRGPRGWNVVIRLCPCLHADLPDGLSVPANNSSSPWFWAESSTGKPRTRNPLFLF